MIPGQWQFEIRFKKIEQWWERYICSTLSYLDGSHIYNYDSWFADCGCIVQKMLNLMVLTNQVVVMQIIQWAFTEGSSWRLKVILYSGNYIYVVLSSLCLIDQTLKVFPFSFWTLKPLGVISKNTFILKSNCTERRHDSLGLG